MNEDDLVSQVRAKGWWQGSLIANEDFEEVADISGVSADWWVVVTQTCNLYSDSLHNVPLFELVGAEQTEECERAFAKGDHPRILSVEALGPDSENIFLKISIQKRVWLSREKLGVLPAPSYSIQDSQDEEKRRIGKDQNLDKFIGWVARSYTRITLPDEFNAAMRASKIAEVIERRLTKNAERLYGIYLSIGADSDEHWGGAIGTMPPPYNLEIICVFHNDVSLKDRKDIMDRFNKLLFDMEVTDPDNSDKKLTRVDLARRNQVRIVPAGIEEKLEGQLNLSDVRSMIRYSFVDHLSDSSAATAE